MPTDYVLELPNDLRAIEAAVNYLIDRAQEIGFNKERLRLNLRVGMTEALANAMLYGNCRDPRKRVRIDAKFASGALTIRVTDEGRGFNPATVSDPTIGRNRMRAGGRGIFLIRKLMDRVEFNERGNSITMVLYNESKQNARESAS
jgi:serine/threonine-protein kinase RsbW